MLKIKLKEEFAETQIGFNNSMAPLGIRNDLDQLLIIAHRSGREDYLAMFDNPPSLDALLEKAADITIGQIPETTLPLGDSAFVAEQDNASNETPTPPVGGEGAPPVTDETVPPADSNPPADTKGRNKK